MPLCLKPRTNNKRERVNAGSKGCELCGYLT